MDEDVARHWQSLEPIDAKEVLRISKQTGTPAGRELALRQDRCLQQLPCMRHHLPLNRPYRRDYAEPMPKLILAVLQQLDAEGVVTALEGAGHRLTQIPSLGGYLGLENVTLMMAAEDSRVDDIISVIEKYCSIREIELPLVVRGRLKDELPRLVKHGGATILIVDLERVLRV